MRKIKALIVRGWTISLRKQRGNNWFNAAAVHTFWGAVDVWDESFTQAVDKMYKVAKELEKGVGTLDD